MNGMVVHTHAHTPANVVDRLKINVRWDMSRKEIRKMVRDGARKQNEYVFVDSMKQQSNVE
jgi:hypothetical protein